MSDNWDFYFCRVDDKPASIFLDLDIEQPAPISDLAHMSYVRLRMNAPRPDGFSSQEESETLNAIEDVLSAGLTADGSTRYVGRNTSDGWRDFYFYAAGAGDWQARVSRLMAPYQDYKFETGSRPDPEWKTYFEFLRPTPVDRQRIENRRVCFNLKKHGDALTQAREIDHWAYFSTEQARSTFVARAAELGYQLKQVADLDKPDRRYRAELSRVDIPNLESIDGITLPLYTLARELDGDYDGWGTTVEKAT
jgi:regulator of RNase E activity RraB